MKGINCIKLEGYPIQEQKLNLFADYLHFYLRFAGLFKDIEFDNPLSYVEKLLYQLQFNVNPDPDRGKFVTYIEGHSTKLLKYPRRYTRKFPAFKPVITLLKSWLALDSFTKKKKAIVNNLSNWVSVFNALQHELHEKMIEQAADELTRQILCDHTVNEHSGSIIFYTQIVASELVFRRGSKSEVQRLISEIMATDYRDFPYSSHIVSDEDKQHFFKNKNVKNTIEAIKDYARQPLVNWMITFIVEKIAINDEEKVVKMANVRFFSNNSSQAKMLKHSLANSYDEDVRTLLDKDKITLCEITVQAVKCETAHIKAIPIAQRAVAYFSKRIDRAVFLNQHNYFFTTDLKNYGYSLRDIWRPSGLTEMEIKQVEDNAYTFFSRMTYACANEFLEYETLYIDARQTEDTSLLWRYLEVLLHYGMGHENVKSLVSGAILLQERKFIRSSMEPYFRNALHTFSTSAENIGITIDEQLEFVRTNKSLKELAPRIKSEWFKKAYLQMTARLTRKRCEAIRHFYYSTLEEAYEMRNFDIHMGRTHYRATIKQRYVISSIINRFRHVLFLYIRANPTLSLSEILKRLVNDVDGRFGEYRKI